MMHKSNTRCQKTTKRKAGRPPVEFTPEQVKKIEDAAFAGCKNETIATLVDVTGKTLVKHFSKVLAQKRAERKLGIYKAQNELLKDKNTAMTIFLGKAVLEQSDSMKLTHELSGQSIADIAAIVGLRALRKVKRDRPKQPKNAVSEQPADKMGKDSKIVSQNGPGSD